ncbi:MAG TPA: methyltransferase domain-containing protein [Acidimicrobiia bacterium]|nr:methyltransferase domain-containing protein [Acidimicrobiia bacterium]
MSDQVSYRNFSGTAAENYERYFVPAIGKPVSDALMAAAALRDGEEVLDVACGTGVATRRAADAVGRDGRVVGLDVAPDMLDVARSVTTATPIEWREGDAASLPFPDATFDVVLSQMGLMFVEDKAAALREARRVLREGGRCVVNTPGAIQPLFEIMDEALARHISPDLAGFVRVVFSMDDPQELEGLLKEAGFSDVTAGTVDVDLRLPAPGDFLWQYINLTPMGAFVGQAPADAREALEREVVTRWEPFTVDGILAGTQPIVQATARR